MFWFNMCLYVVSHWASLMDVSDAHKASSSIVIRLDPEKKLPHVYVWVWWVRPKTLTNVLNHWCMFPNGDYFQLELTVHPRGVHFFTQNSQCFLKWRKRLLLPTWGCYAPTTATTSYPGQDVPEPNDNVRGLAANFRREEVWLHRNRLQLSESRKATEWKEWIRRS